MLLKSPDETRAFARELAKTLAPNSVIALYGDLGAGKTTFVQGLLSGLGGDPSEAHSPTFTYMHCYPGKLPLTHFDLYRLRSSDDFLGMGFDEAFYAGSVVAIEWPERIAALLPSPHLEIRLSHESEETRTLEMRWT